MTSHFEKIKINVFLENFIRRKAGCFGLWCDETSGALLLLLLFPTAGQAGPRSNRRAAALTSFCSRL